ncbi:MAG TPA: hypothetical protein VKU41_21365, partial [Polyangiaceae bacterium]|nr:hypothetical protein [Polyangiaceae bacterium]
MSRTTTRPRVFLFATSCFVVAAAVACRPKHDNGTWCPEGLASQYCSGAHYCDSVMGRFPATVDSAWFGIDACHSGGRTSLYGWWPLERLGSSRFEWEAPVAQGAAFPVLNHALVNTGCFHDPHDLA